MVVHIIGPFIGGGIAGFVQLWFIDSLAEMKKYALEGDTGLGAEDSEWRRKGTALEDLPLERKTTKMGAGKRQIVDNTSS